MDFDFDSYSDFDSYFGFDFDFVFGFGFDFGFDFDCMTRRGKEDSSLGGYYL